MLMSDTATTSPSVRSHRSGDAPFPARTRRFLDRLTELGLRPQPPQFWQFPPQRTVSFGAGSGWLWGEVTISGATGRLTHIKLRCNAEDGTEQLTTVDGPTAITAALEQHAARRVERIAALARRHGLTVTHPDP